MIQGADFQSVSIRSVGDPVLAMGMSGISKRQVGVLGMEIVDVCPPAMSRSLVGWAPSGSYTTSRETGELEGLAARYGFILRGLQ